MSGRQALSSCGALAMGTAMLLTAASATAAPSMASAGGWHRQHVEAPDGGYSTVNGVFVASRGDAWIAGAAGREGRFRRTAMIEHWDGQRFARASTPDIPHAQSPEFFGMSGTGPNDVWAVGEYGATSGGSQSLIEHFDGTR